MVLHQVARDERARPPRPRPAVHRHGARDGLGRAEEGVDEGGGRLRAVAEGEVEVLEPERPSRTNSSLSYSTSFRRMTSCTP